MNSNFNGFGMAAGGFLQAFTAARMAKEAKADRDRERKLASQLFELQLKKLQDEQSRQQQAAQEAATQQRLALINRNMIRGEAELGVASGQYPDLTSALASEALRQEMLSKGFDPVKDFGVRMPSSEEMEYERAQRDPGFAQYQLAKRAAGSTNINLGGPGIPDPKFGYVRPDPSRPGVEREPGFVTPAQEAVDSQFAPIYAEWVTRGGWSDVDKQLEQLRMAAEELQKGGVTGPAAGLTASGDARGAILNPRTVKVRDAVLESVQRNLRLVLGAQFTQREGEMLLARAFNPYLPDAENLRRVNALIKQIETAANSTDLAARYYEGRGTLAGYKGLVGGAKEGLGTTPPQLGAPALPAGIPAGSRLIGTSGGKPVYEAPDGRQYIVE